MSLSPGRGVSSALFFVTALLPACAGPAETDNKPPPIVVAAASSGRAVARSSLASMAPTPGTTPPAAHPTIDPTQSAQRPIVAKDRPNKKTVKAGKTEPGAHHIVRPTAAKQRSTVVRNKKDAASPTMGKESGLYVFLLPQPRGGEDVLERLKIFHGCIDKAGTAGSHKKIVFFLPLAKEMSVHGIVTQPSDKLGLSTLGEHDPNVTLLATNAPLPFPRCGW